MKQGYKSCKIDEITKSAIRALNYEMLDDRDDDYLYAHIPLNKNEYEFVERWNVRTIFNEKVGNSTQLLRDAIKESAVSRGHKLSDKNVEKALKVWEMNLANRY